MESQRWIFMSPGGENDYKKPSVTHQHYGDAIALEKERIKEKLETENEKRREFESKMWEKMIKKESDQIKEDRDKLEQNQNVQEMGSLYSDSYVKPGFKVKELGTDIDEELVRKYGPLCADPRRSIYVKKLFYRTKARDNMHKPADRIFRRSSQFTNRLSNPFDCHALVGPGHFAYV